MITESITGALVVVILFAIHSIFKDRREARLHEKTISNELLAETKDLLERVKAYETSLENFKTTLVAVLKDMHEIVKNTESERQRTAGVAAGMLLRPGKRS